MAWKGVRADMKAALAAVLMSAIAACGALTTKAEVAPLCEMDWAALLAMSPETFDQDLNGGWRPWADIPACLPAVADLLRDYRLENPGLPEDDLNLIQHHEYQIRASDGQTKKAIELLKELIATEENHAGLLYKRAALAFLEKDRPALLAARAELANLPMPPYFAAMAQDWNEKYPDSKPLVWPVNLDVVDALITCFDKTYAVAYGDYACRENPKPQ